MVYFQDKAELEDVVAVHVAHILTYQQERDPKSGQYVYKMDPDVKSIVCYPGTKRLINLTYGIKQMFAHEVRLEKMWLEAGGRRRSRLPEVPQRDANGGTNHLQKFTAKPVEFKTRAPTDFVRRALKVEYSRHLRLIDAYQKPFNFFLCPRKTIVIWMKHLPSFKRLNLI